MSSIENQEFYPEETSKNNVFNRRNFLKGLLAIGATSAVENTLAGKGLEKGIEFFENLDSKESVEKIDPEKEIQNAFHRMTIPSSVWARFRDPFLVWKKGDRRVNLPLNTVEVENPETNGKFLFERNNGTFEGMVEGFKITFNMGKSVKFENESLHLNLDYEWNGICSGIQMVTRYFTETNLMAKKPAVIHGRLTVEDKRKATEFALNNPEIAHSQEYLQKQEADVKTEDRINKKNYLNYLSELDFFRRKMEDLFGIMVGSEFTKKKWEFVNKQFPIETKILPQASTTPQGSASSSPSALGVE